MERLDFNLARYFYMQFDLNGQVIFDTGAARGIGPALADRSKQPLRVAGAGFAARLRRDS